MRQTIAIAAAAILLGGLASQAYAQGQTTQGLFGSRTTGGATGLSAGQGTFGGGQTQTGGGQGVLENTIQGQQGQLQNARFQRDSRTGQFVGAGGEDVNAASTLLGGAGQGGAQIGRNQLQQLLQQGQQQSQSTQPQQASGRELPYRVSRQLGYRYQPTVTSSNLNARLAQRLRQSTRLELRGPLEVAMQGRKAILKGSVATDYDRVLAAQLVLLQPGVYEVENQLTIAPDEPARLPR